MLKKTYNNNFTDTAINIKDFIKSWPDEIDEENITKFVNLKNASMIFVPMIQKKKIQKNYQKFIFFAVNVQNGIKFVVQLKILKGMQEFMFQKYLETVIKMIKFLH